MNAFYSALYDRLRPAPVSISLDRAHPCALIRARECAWSWARRDARGPM